jgi:hypothetical protein
MLDVSLALVAGGFDEVQVVLGREMRRQQADRREGQVTRREPLQEHRILACDASRLDAPIRGVL